MVAVAVVEDMAETELKAAIERKTSLTVHRGPVSGCRLCWLDLLRCYWLSSVA